MQAYGDILGQQCAGVRHTSCHRQGPACHTAAEVNANHSQLRLQCVAEVAMDHRQAMSYSIDKNTAAFRLARHACTMMAAACLHGLAIYSTVIILLSRYASSFYKTSYPSLFVDLLASVGVLPARRPVSLTVRAIRSHWVLLPAPWLQYMGRQAWAQVNKPRDVQH